MNSLHSGHFCHNGLASPYQPKSLCLAATGARSRNPRLFHARCDVQSRHHPSFGASSTHRMRPLSVATLLSNKIWERRSPRFARVECGDHESTLLLIGFARCPPVLEKLQTLYVHMSSSKNSKATEHHTSLN
jgi:hypothetical protein